MEYRQLGRSGLRVSVLSMGTTTFTGGEQTAVGSSDVAQARRLVDRCLDAGVNLIDTSDAYSSGVAESIVGDVLHGRRDRMLIATKVRFASGPGPNDAGLSRHHILKAAEASLRRLKTDHIDIYFMHAWDGLTPIEETLAALEMLERSGKVRYIGASNFSGWHLMKTLWAADRNGLPRLSCQQIHYTLYSREAENELIPIAVDQGLGTLVWSPLAGGLLSGKYRRGEPPPQGSRHAGDWHEPPVYDEDGLYDIIDVLREIADDRGVTAAQVSLAYLRSRPSITSLVIGARHESQLTDNLASTELDLSSEETARLDKISQPHLPYPYWHQAQSITDRMGAADLSLHAAHR